MRSSRLPAVKTLAQFDFAFQPSIKREQIESLHELGFLDRRENVIFLGPPGVGKTHLAISLAITGVCLTTIPSLRVRHFRLTRMRHFRTLLGIFGCH